MAPVSVEVQPLSSGETLRGVAREGSYEVVRNFTPGHLDIFSDLYISNSYNFHVWTNNLVIRAGIKIDNTPTPNVKIIGLQDLRRLDQRCLDDPEKHFYLK